MKTKHPRQLGGPYGCHRKQKGFTLVELAIVGLFLAVLVVYAVSRFSSSGANSQKAAAMIDSARKITDGWSLIYQQCAVSPDISLVSLANVSTPSIARANQSAILGTTSFNSAYSPCVNASGVKVLSSLTRGLQGQEQLTTGHLLGTPSVFKQNGTNYLSIEIRNVQDDIAQFMVQKLKDPSATISATADSTDIHIRYDAPSGGLRTVYVINPL